LGAANDNDELFYFLQNLFYCFKMSQMKRLEPSDVESTPNQETVTATVRLNATSIYYLRLRNYCKPPKLFLIKALIHGIQAGDYTNQMSFTITEEGKLNLKERLKKKFANRSLGENAICTTLKSVARVSFWKQKPTRLPELRLQGTGLRMPCRQGIHQHSPQRIYRL
jgi:hypothetical protein